MAFDVAVLQQYGLPAELASQLATVADNFSDDFGESISRLSLKGFQFSIVSGGASNVVQGSEQGLNCVIIAEGPHDFNTWYRSSYDPSAEATQPDAVWYEGTEIPAVVPPQMRSRRPDGRLNWSRKRRVLIVPMGSDGKPLNGMEPVIFDVGASSLYGQDMAGGLGLSYAHYRAWCKQHRLAPCLIPTRIVFDRSASVPSVRFVPGCDQTGRPQVFGAQALQLILETAKSDRVKELVQVKLVPEAGAMAQPAPQPQPAPVYNTMAQPAYAQPQPAPQPAPVAQPQPAPQPVAQPASAPVEPQIAPDALLDSARKDIAGADADLNALLQAAAVPQGNPNDLPF